MDDISKLLKIRYVKIHFTVEMTENCILPVHKSSALRGGMGEMLLRSNCIEDRNCDECGFSDECLVRRVLYSKMEILPRFMNSGESVGYVIECDDHRENFSAGDTLNFSIILFGKTICWFSQILGAFYSLGMSGLGSDDACFTIKAVTNSKREPIMDGDSIDITRLGISTVGDYVRYRRRKLSAAGEKKIEFRSPLTVKYNKEFIDEFSMEAVLDSACRRLFILDCYEGIESGLGEREYTGTLPVPKVLEEKHRKVSVRRYSNHTKTGMYLEGITGSVTVENIPEEILDILIAGELTHIGKNTSFGFGRYRIEMTSDEKSREDI